MLNKLPEFMRRYEMVRPGDRVVCAVSGGADSMALLWCLYLLKDKLDLQVCAAHFNHGLRGAESDRDEAFVRQFCDRYDIPLYVGSGAVLPGEKGLEAAARDARYAFLNTLPGKLATAHTANDNAETVLMHLVRGTGLKGLGGITPVSGRLIRPMLSVTRQEVLDFLNEYHISYVTDSSNATDAFLRNRLRHHVMPLLEKENPRLAGSLSEMALGLREDEKLLASLETGGPLPDIHALRAMEPARRSRVLTAFLQQCGVKEPSREHIAQAEKLVFSQKPSAKASFPGGVTVCRSYDRLECRKTGGPWGPIELPCPGSVDITQLGLRVTCRPALEPVCTVDRFTVKPVGTMTLRSRESGDTLRLSGGTKSLKKLFIDAKIPAARRQDIPVLADKQSVLGVCGVGANLDRVCREMPCVEISFEKISPANREIGGFSE